MKRVLVTAMFFACVSFSLAHAKEKPLCLPIGHKAIQDFPLNESITLDRDLIVAGTKLPKGCVIEISYGPEVPENASKAQQRKSKIISKVMCESISLGKYTFADSVYFDSNFCLTGSVSATHEIVFCGKKLPVRTLVEFGRGVPACFDDPAGTGDK